MKIDHLTLDKTLNQWIKSCDVIKSINFLDFIPKTIGFPEVTPELIIILSGHLNVAYSEKLYDINVSCFFTFIDKPIVITPSSSIHIIKITFHSYGVYPLLQLTGIASKELTYSPIIFAKDIFGNEIQTLEQKLFESKSKIELENHLNDFFICKLCKTGISQIGHSFLNLTKFNFQNVDDLCNALHVTPRTLQRWFSQNMDISPKFYLRLLRLKALINDLSSSHDQDYLSIAIKNGYYDQNHMIKEIKFFTDQTPKEISFDQYLPIQLVKN